MELDFNLQMKKRSKLFLSTMTCYVATYKYPTNKPWVTVRGRGDKGTIAVR